MKIMKEFGQDGKTITQTSIFVNDKLGSIEKLRSDNKYDVVVLDKKGAISTCNEGYEKIDNNLYHIDKQAQLYSSGSMSYKEGYTYGHFGEYGIYSMTDKELGIFEGKPAHYIENSHMSDMHGFAAAKSLHKIKGKWTN